MYKEKEVTCKFCQSSFKSKEKSPKFCSLRCSSSYNNRLRNLSESSKQKISRSLKNRKFEYEYKCDKCDLVFFLNYRVRQDRAIHCSSCKRKISKRDISKVNNILELSKRTISKIFKRLNIGCSLCGWNCCVCDIHHINPKAEGGGDEHENLTYVCPNCHRMLHNGLIDSDRVINLKDHIGETWRKKYNLGIKKTSRK